MSPDRPRPASIRRGPAPTEPPQQPGEVRVVFHLDSGGELGVIYSESKVEEIRMDIGHAWNAPDGQMFTVVDKHGPSLLVNLGRVAFVEFRR